LKVLKVVLTLHCQLACLQPVLAPLNSPHVKVILTETHINGINVILKITK
jgi:hypothetical protein